MFQSHSIVAEASEETEPGLVFPEPRVQYLGRSIQSSGSPVEGLGLTANPPFDKARSCQAAFPVAVVRYSRGDLHHFPLARLP